MTPEQEFQRQIAAAFESSEPIVELTRASGERVRVDKQSLNGAGFTTTYFDAEGVRTHESALFGAAVRRPDAYPAGLPFLPGFETVITTRFPEPAGIELMWVTPFDHAREHRARLNDLFDQPELAAFKAAADRFVQEKPDLADPAVRQEALDKLTQAAGAGGIESLVDLFRVPVERRARFNSAIDDVVRQSREDGWEVSGREDNSMLTKVHLHRPGRVREVAVFYFGPTPAFSLRDASAE